LETATVQTGRLSQAQEAPQTTWAGLQKRATRNTSPNHRRETVRTARRSYRGNGERLAGRTHPVQDADTEAYPVRFSVEHVRWASAARRTCGRLHPVGTEDRDSRPGYIVAQGGGTRSARRDPKGQARTTTLPSF